MSHCVSRHSDFAVVSRNVYSAINELASYSLGVYLFVCTSSTYTGKLWHICTWYSMLFIGEVHCVEPHNRTPYGVMLILL